MLFSLYQAPTARHPSVLPPEGNAGGSHPPALPNIEPVECVYASDSNSIERLVTYINSNSI